MEEEITVLWGIGKTVDMVDGREQLASELKVSLGGFDYDPLDRSGHCRLLNKPCMSCVANM